MKNSKSKSRKRIEKCYGRCHKCKEILEAKNRDELDDSFTSHIKQRHPISIAKGIKMVIISKPKTK